MKEDKRLNYSFAVAVMSKIEKKPSFIIKSAIMSYEFHNDVKLRDKVNSKADQIKPFRTRSQVESSKTLNYESSRLLQKNGDVSQNQIPRIK